MPLHSDLRQHYDLLVRLTHVDTALRDMAAEPNETMPRIVVHLASTNEPITLNARTHHSISNLAHDLLRQEFIALTIELAEHGYFPDHDNLSGPPLYVNVYSISRSYAGPGEGGSYYTLLTPLTFEGPFLLTNPGAAEAAHHRLAEAYSNTDNYHVVVEHTPPTTSPRTPPLYE